MREILSIDVRRQIPDKTVSDFDNPICETKSESSLLPTMKDGVFDSDGGNCQQVNGVSKPVQTSGKIRQYQRTKIKYPLSEGVLSKK
jgi:hypothetical protein